MPWSSNLVVTVAGGDPELEAAFQTPNPGLDPQARLYPTRLEFMDSDYSFRGGDADEGGCAHVQTVARPPRPQVAHTPDPHELFFINARQGYEFDFLYTPGLALAGVAGLAGARE